MNIEANINELIANIQKTRLMLGSMADCYWPVYSSILDAEKHIFEALKNLKTQESFDNCLQGY